MQRLIANIFRITSRVTIVLGGVVLILMMLQICIDIVLRSLDFSGIHSNVEVVTRYYMVAVSFLPLAFSEIRRSHIEATVFIDLLPTAIQNIIVYVGFVLSLALYALLTYTSASEAFSRTRSGAYVEVGASHFSIWPTYWILPIAFFLMSLILVARIVSGPTNAAETTIQPVE